MLLDGSLLILAGIVLIAGLMLAARRGQRLLWERQNLSAAQRIVALAAGLMVFLGIWYLGNALNPTGPTRIPTPQATVIAAINYLGDTGWLDVVVSMTRVLVSFSIAAAISMLLAFLFAMHSVTTSAFSPPLSFIRYIPPTAFTALLVIYFGIGEFYKSSVIFVGVFFFNFRMTLDILEDFDVRYIELARLTGESFRRRQGVWWLFRTTVIPASWPRLWDMLRINLSFAWTFLVVAETVGANNGLGKSLYLAQRFFRVEDVYACILLFGVIGLTFDAAMAQLKRMLFRWHDESTSR
ncbi:MAG TPA: ABC transporter permease [Rhizomicrobium sp.]